MFTLIENGEIYAPEPMGRTSVLLAGSEILKIGNVDTRALAHLDLPIETKAIRIARRRDSWN